ncbi:uncharacterized protein L969DRAFT_98315 [Mixia osmundae IAM 14324]|uniref:Rho-GAP domain-containing protein n=1 Tax=Mixia osmundae (strain CBS 9802 / IAM 14324 / JCM 22182 / KY 12970) TaxID=764103 RepID=G7DTQ7_MIXOS|nr:uncharacterized protein L969DRAFT_98315 [Mixia osmundae IAM 14324]KEI41682.1 hypothetical protein L969DRAFT_98315 [Mixia osmundae IAM 14324]GAA93967.1 hypothetical protein E5Q_00613 [Mixia osmundae IAM 14324]
MAAALAPAPVEPLPDNAERLSEDKSLPPTPARREPIDRRAVSSSPSIDRRRAVSPALNTNISASKTGFKARLLGRFSPTVAGQHHLVSAERPSSRALATSPHSAAKADTASSAQDDQETIQSDRSTLKAKKSMTFFGLGQPKGSKSRAQQRAKSQQLEQRPASAAATRKTDTTKALSSQRDGNGVSKNDEETQGGMRRLVRSASSQARRRSTSFTGLGLGTHPLSSQANDRSTRDRSQSASSTRLLHTHRTPSPGRKTSARYASTSTAPSDPGELIYGYWGIETARDMSIERVHSIVAQCASEIRSRGLDSPLLFSTTAIDITTEGVHALITACHQQMSAFRAEAEFAGPHDLAAMVKYSLARITNQVGGHGCLTYDLYEIFRKAEASTEYRKGCLASVLLQALPAPSAELIRTLLELFASVIAYTTRNGATPRKLAALFSAYLFSLPDTENFEVTYSTWARISCATEHIILAFIRDQRARPARLNDFVSDYPTSLTLLPSVWLERGRVIQARRCSRTVRFSSQDLIKSAGTWELTHAEWSQLAHAPTPSSSGANVPAYTSSYRHLLNIRNDDDEDEEADLRYKSANDKAWSAFKDVGFSASLQDQLKFDLTESERAERKNRHQTLDWSTFSSSGFSDRESYLPGDLDFDTKVSQSVDHWPQERRDLTARMRKTEAGLPSFPYDITPREQGVVNVDELFVEAWADVLISSGWTRDELKPTSWALLQYKTRRHSANLESSLLGNEASGNAWYLMIETVPQEYLLDLAEGKASKKSKRVSFFRPVRRKKSNRNLRTINEINGRSHDSLRTKQFDAFLGSENTKQVSLDRKPTATLGHQPSLDSLNENGRQNRNFSGIRGLMRRSSSRPDKRLPTAIPYNMPAEDVAPVALADISIMQQSPSFVSPGPAHSDAEKPASPGLAAPMNPTSSARTPRPMPAVADLYGGIEDEEASLVDTSRATLSHEGNDYSLGGSDEPAQHLPIPTPSPGTLAKEESPVLGRHTPVLVAPDVPHDANRISTATPESGTGTVESSPGRSRISALIGLYGGNDTAAPHRSHAPAPVRLSEYGFNASSSPVLGQR